MDKIPNFVFLKLPFSESILPIVQWKVFRLDSRPRCLLKQWLNGGRTLANRARCCKLTISHWANGDYHKGTCHSHMYLSRPRYCGNVWRHCTWICQKIQKNGAKCILLPTLKEELRNCKWYFSGLSLGKPGLTNLDKVLLELSKNPYKYMISDVFGTLFIIKFLL